MSGTFTVTMGDRGRLVVPAEVRSRAGLAEGVPLILVSSDTGIVLLTRHQAKAHLRAQLGGTDLVASLLNDRRVEAHDEDLA